MVRNNFKKIALGLFASLLIPASVFASDSSDPIDPLGAGQWDPVGSEVLDIYPGGVINTVKNFTSKGGNFQIRIRDVQSANSYTVSLWEYDPDNPDDQVGKKLRKTGNADITYDTSGYVDGSDGDAELYVKIESVYSAESIIIYAYD